MTNRLRLIEKDINKKLKYLAIEIMYFNILILIVIVYKQI